MSPNACALIALLWGAAQGPVAESPGARPLRATFIGNMAFHLSDGETELLTDFPYESGAFGYMTWARDAVPPGTGRLCLMTHSHRDHFAPELVPEHCAAVLGPEDVVGAAGVEALRPQPVVRWRGLAIHPVATPHASLEHYSYLVEWSGLRLYFTGDTEDPGALLAARDLDVAFVSPWLLRTIADDGRRVDARRVVVYHHATGEAVVDGQSRTVPRPGDVLDLSTE